ncbi:hypothetical protein ACX1N5_01515 [Acinetobacter sp. ANC 4636]
MSDIQRRIDERLNQLFSFKREGDWYRQGVCPQCSKKELYTHAINPRIVKCGRLSAGTVRSKLAVINQGTIGKHLYDPEQADALLTMRERRGRARKN